MNDFLQPDFYRFNEDSLLLIEKIKSKIINPDTILDVGAGCGVIGIELSKYYRPKRLHLLELQAEYEFYLKENIKMLDSEIDAQVFISNFSCWSRTTKYDLIVCNPPYYLPGRGQLSKDSKRTFARTFLVDGWRELIPFILQSLTENGKSYVVFKNQKEILKEVEDNLKKNNSNYHLEFDKSLVFLEILGLNKN
jgi:tRNA1Val (adenine37-N6)-methyltransferase